MCRQRFGKRRELGIRYCQGRFEVRLLSCPYYALVLISVNNLFQSFFIFPYSTRKESSEKSAEADGGEAE
jgi:hypothetical protein